MTKLRKLMLEELQGRKSLYGCLIPFKKRRLDLVPEISKFSNHLPSAQLLGSLAEPWAALFISHTFMQNQPNQAALAMRDGSDGLVMSKACDHPSIHNLEDAALRSGAGVRDLIE